MIGPISPEVKQMGARSAGNPHAALRRGGGWKRGTVGIPRPTGAPVLDPTCVQVRLACSAGQSCRGKSQSPVVRIAEEMETEPSKPIDKISRGEITSHRAVSKENALWPRKK